MYLCCHVSLLYWWVLHLQIQPTQGGSVVVWICGCRTCGCRTCGYGVWAVRDLSIRRVWYLGGGGFWNQSLCDTKGRLFFKWAFLIYSNHCKHTQILLIIFIHKWRGCFPSRFWRPEDTGFLVLEPWEVTISLSLKWGLYRIYMKTIQLSLWDTAGAFHDN